MSPEPICDADTKAQHHARDQNRFWAPLLYKLTHWFLAGNAHGLHSPFVYDLYTRALRPKASHANGELIALPAAVVDSIEVTRATFLQRQDLLQIEDLGAGSSYTGARIRQVSIAQWTHRTAKNATWAAVLARGAAFLQPKVILELGTSLGFSTAYLAAACPTATIHTLEGSAPLATEAERWHRSLGLCNITYHVGNADDLLPSLVPMLKPDFVFLDANHTEEATLRYFHTLLPYCGPDTCLVFDDIHWSAGMHSAWQQIKQHPAVRQTVDMGQLGWVFFRNGVGHYRLR